MKGREGERRSDGLGPSRILPTYLRVLRRVLAENMENKGGDSTTDRKIMQARGAVCLSPVPSTRVMPQQRICRREQTPERNAPGRGTEHLEKKTPTPCRLFEFKCIWYGLTMMDNDTTIKIPRKTPSRSRKQEAKESEEEDVSLET
jgi:hypothetical protein